MEEHRCFICGGQLGFYSKCDACYDAKGAERDRIRAHNDRLIDSLKYILGIVERGTGQDALDHIPIKQQVLGYVMFLEADNERLQLEIEYQKSIEAQMNLINNSLNKTNERLREALHFYIDDDECKYGLTESGPIQYCDDSEACRWCKGKQALGDGA